MPSGLIDPLSIQPKDVEVVWTISPPKKHNGKGVLNKRIEDICTKEAAKHGYDKILIRYVCVNLASILRAEMRVLSNANKHYYY